MLITKGEKPNQFFNAQPVPNATSKVIWRKIGGGSVKFAKAGGTKQSNAGRDLELGIKPTKRRKLKPLRIRRKTREEKSS